MYTIIIPFPFQGKLSDFPSKGNGILKLYGFVYTIIIIGIVLSSSSQSVKLPPARWPNVGENGCGRVKPLTYPSAMAGNQNDKTKEGNLVKLQEVGRILQVSQGTGFIWPTMTPLGQKN